MSDQDDNTTGFVLAVVLAVAALVIAGVLGLAIGTTRHHEAPAQAAVPAVVEEVIVEKIFFEVNAEGLPADGAVVVTRMVEFVRARPGAHVVISGYHDATGDPQVNEELAKRRAQSVHAALVAAGIAAEQLEMSKPAETTGGAEGREARRVELRLR